MWKRKERALSLLISCIILAAAIQGCAVYYKPPQLLDSQAATICGIVTGLNPMNMSISAIGVTAVDSVRVGKDSGRVTILSPGYHSEQQITKIIAGDLTQPVKLTPGVRDIEVSFRRFTPDGYYHFRATVSLDCKAGHKYETRFDERVPISSGLPAINVYIIDLQTKEKQAGIIAVLDKL